MDWERREDWRASWLLRLVSRGRREAVSRLSHVDTRDSCRTTCKEYIIISTTYCA